MTTEVLPNPKPTNLGGRPPKRQKYAPIIKASEKRLYGILPQAVSSLEDLVCGIQVQEVDRKGRERIYSLPPNVEAIKLLFKYTLGEPKDDDPDALKALQVNVVNVIRATPELGI